MRLTRNTLLNISKHSNKTIRLADFIVKAQNDLFLNKLARLDAEIDEVTLIEEFHKDLNDTTKKIVDIHSLLSTVDDNGEVLHLKGEKRLKEIFGNAYNLKEQKLELPFCEIDLHKEINREALKAAIVKKVLGLSAEEYNSFYSQRKNTFKLNENELHTEDEKIEYLASLGLRKIYQPAVDKIKELINNNITFRKNMTLEDRSLMDNEITFTKSMVDSVAQASLYITKEKGVTQWGSGFKTKYKKEVEELVKALKDNPYVEAIELDKDTDPSAFLNLLNQVKEINFNLKAPVILKSRKLGVYRASGLFYPSENIVAVDVEDPSAAIHEFIHAKDILNPELGDPRQRSRLAQALRSRISTDILSKQFSKTRFIKELSTTEIIARTGELAYLWEKYDYQPNKENYQDFKNRVIEGQKIENIYDLNLIKNIEDYEKQENRYFGFTTMRHDWVDTIRKYYRSYYRTNKNDPLEPFTSVELPARQPHEVVKQVKRYEKTCLSGLKSDTLKEILEYNDKKKIIDPEILINKMLSESTTIGRTTKALREEVANDQEKCFEVLCDWAFENKKFYEMSRIVEAFYQSYPFMDLEKICFFDYADKNKTFSNHSTYLDHYEEFKNKSFELIEKQRENTDNYHNEEIEYGDFRRISEELIKEYKNNYNRTMMKGYNDYNKLVRKSPLFEKLLEQRLKTKKINEKDGNLPARYINRRFSKVLNMLHKTIERDGNEIANYFSKEDLAPKIALLNDDEKLRSIMFYIEKEHGITIGTYKHNKIHNLMRQNLKASGEYNTIKDINERVQVKVSRGERYLASPYALDNALKVRVENPNLFSNNKNCMEFNLKEKFFNLSEGQSAEQYLASLPELIKYDDIQNNVKKLKEDFEFENINLEIINNNSLKDNQNVEKQKNKPEKPKEKRNNRINDIEKNIEKSNEPIDPNPKMEEKSKKRGRKKKIDPNQQNLF